MFRKQIAVDLGTANTLVYTESDGIVINEPSVVAVNTVQGHIIAIGKEAKEFIGKTPQGIRTVRPLRDGVIADFDMARALVAHFLHKVIGGGMKPDVVMCVPTRITEVERKAVKEAAAQSGAKGIKLIAEPVAAAIGAGMPVLEPAGNMVIDIGGGTTDIAIISLGSLVYGESIRLAGDALTLATQRCLYEKAHIVVGENMAEKIKIGLGSVMPFPQSRKMVVSGKDVVTGKPTTVEVDDGTIRDALVPLVDTLVESVTEVLEKADPELGADIMRRGILLTGGGALIHGLDERLHQATGMPVHIDTEPLTTVLRGAGITLGKQGLYGDILSS